MNSALRLWAEANVSRFAGSVLFDEPLAKHTYYRIGGPAEMLAIPKGVDDLRLLEECAKACGVPVTILGAGSNVLVSDLGVPGLTIKTTRLSIDIEIRSATLVFTGAGVAVSTLLRRAAQEGWGGLEFLAGVPGAIGGVVAMNAGTHLGEAKDRVRRVEAYVPGTGPLSFHGSALKFEYRRNLFLPPGAIVTGAEWEISRGDPASVKKAIDETLARRKSTQPIEFPSCGSVFKNPSASPMKAWQVLDRLGLRGHRMGGAQISEKHSNFIVNLGGASAADVRGLIQLAKSRSLAELGIQLEEEVRYIGAFE